ncbi:MAG: nickel-dependent hydrogenase large subunit [Campylobacterales bacterium]
MSKNHIIVDPITRIEGHLRIEAVIEDGVIVDAYSSSGMFRGIETILKGRDPRDAGLLAMRICGVCTGTHYQRSIEAVEDAFNVTVPDNARITRNLIQGALFVHDHPVHFYNLAGLDWVDVVSALSADPQKAVDEAHRWSDTPYNCSTSQYTQVLERIKKFVDQGRLGIFANGYWGNPSYKFTPEQNLIALSHYLDILELQRDIAKMHAIFGGKSPHPQSIVVGGVTCVQDIENPPRITEYKHILNKARHFIKTAYIPDVLMAGTVYADEALAGVGAGLGNFMSFGGFRLDNNPMYQGKMLFPDGIVLNKDLSKVFEFDQKKITEDVTHAWYKGSKPLHPFDGETEPEFTGYRTGEDGYAYLKTEEKYSFLKAPNYDDTRMEVGPLARMVVGYAKGDELIQKYVNDFLQRGNLPASVLFSTVGRTAARAIETDLIADEMVKWCDELLANSTNRKLETWTQFDFDTVSKDADGYGLEEAPRGALGHWVRIKDGHIENYQAVVPSTWNASPRDDKGRMGAYEASLIGTKVADVNQPLEIIRTIHSFDPCIACAVHLVDTKGKELSSYKVNPGGCNV